MQPKELEARVAQQTRVWQAEEELQALCTRLGVVLVYDQGQSTGGGQYARFTFLAVTQEPGKVVGTIAPAQTGTGEVGP